MLSWIGKNLGKHTMETQDVWATKNLLWQKTTPSKKRRVGDNLFLAEEMDENNQAGASDGPTYFFNLKI